MTESPDLTHSLNMLTLRATLDSLENFDHVGGIKYTEDVQKCYNKLKKILDQMLADVEDY